MYKPKSNVVVPQKPGKWETAVYQAATSPLTESLPKPQTRIEQLAQEFVCGKEVSSSISKLKEINRCITVYESYVAYQKDPAACTNSLLPPHINVGYGKKETALSTGTESKDAPEDKVNSAPAVSADMERTPEQAKLMEQVEKDYKTEMHSVEQARELCNKVRAVLSTTVYKTLTNRDKSQIYFIFNQLSERKEQLEVQEAQKLQQKGYTCIGNMLRAPYYEDPAKDVRQEPQNAVDHLTKPDFSSLSLEELYAKRASYPKVIPAYLYYDEVQFVDSAIKIKEKELSGK